MFGVLAGLREICVCALDARVLVAVAELIGEAMVAVVVMLFIVPGAFGAVGIVIRNFRHGEAPDLKNY